MDLYDYGWTEDMMPKGAEGEPARVSAVHKERYELISRRGICYGKLKAGVYYGGGEEEFPETGDFVLIHYNERGDSQIIKTLERKSKFARYDLSGHKAEYAKTVLEQVVAANFDYVFILQSLNRGFNLRRLERYLTLAWESGAIPAVVLTKADLTEDYGEQLRLAREAAGVAEVFVVSACTGYGLEELCRFLKPRSTVVFLGSSGVGKSSLVNALAGEELMEVKEIREKDGRGRHTTTRRQLMMLQNGAMIIDTPGMREIGMWGVDAGLGEAFTDVEYYTDRCRFSDCSHESEPGCAVKAALESGELSRERWESYLKIQRDATYANDRAGYLNVKQQRFKEIARKNRERENLEKGKKDR